jgi:hypothetical protein
MDKRRSVRQYMDKEFNTWRNKLYRASLIGVNKRASVMETLAQGSGVIHS